MLRNNRLLHLWLWMMSTKVEIPNMFISGTQLVICSVFIVGANQKTPGLKGKELKLLEPLLKCKA